jgi:hypothetical protein
MQNSNGQFVWKKHLCACPLYTYSSMSLSTGLKTPQGKQRSSLNAVKHGILSSKWLSQDELDAFNHLVQDLESEYQPDTATQRIMVERIAMAMTKLRRLYALENALHLKAQHEAAVAADSPRAKFVLNISPDLAKASAMPSLKQLDLMARYQTSLDRQISKTIGELIHLKNNPSMAHLPSAKLLGDA